MDYDQIDRYTRMSTNHPLSIDPCALTKIGEFTEGLLSCYLLSNEDTSLAASMEIEVFESSYRDWNRRRFIKLALMLPVSASLAHFRLLPQSQATQGKLP